MSRLVAAARLGTQLPEPGRLWVRFVPRPWPGPEAPWTDLARGGLGERRTGASETELPAIAGPLDDLLYLPPVAPADAAARDELARARLADGTPVLVQLLPGEATAAEGAVAVLDPLPALLAGDLDALARPAGASAAVWPLVPGLTDDPALWEEGCARLAAAGVSTVQAVALALAPADRRRLAAGAGEAAYEALFHREPPPERGFARVAGRHGLAPFLERPLPRPPVLGIEGRRLAGALALAAEVARRLGRPDAEAESSARAARFVDRSRYDLAAIAREGNLGVLGWLEGTARGIVEEIVGAGRSTTLDALLDEYAHQDEPRRGEGIEPGPSGPGKAPQTLPSPEGATERGRKT